MFLARHSRARKWYNKNMFKKKLQAEDMEKSSLWGLLQRKAGRQRKPWFHQATWRIILSIFGRRKYCVMTAGQTKLFVQKPPRRAVGRKKSSKWSDEPPQTENAVVRFSSWFCACWNEHSVGTFQFPLFWWEKLIYSGLERSAGHKPARCLQSLLQIWATQFIPFRLSLQI